ncbi:predicted response regulator receiver [gamma proteobacterium HdN1]|nr:predicted response regulator receiver [gamma proteobacterium HdN1]
MPTSKILMVDDEPANLKILHEMLAGDHYDLSVAANGARALEIAKIILPDLILLDVRLPDMDGFEVCRQLKADSATQAIPVVFVTGSLESVSTGFAVGGVDYLTKPVRREELQARVKTHLQISGLLREIADKNRGLELAQEQLEQRVNERTQELREANERLQREISERRFAEERIQYLARHDYLTHLLTRTAFEETLTSLLSRIADEKAQHVLLYMDLDQFKLVNDTSGHMAGDELLCQVAELLRRHLRAHDIAARLGGDDFAIILYNATPESGKATAEEIIKAIGNLAFQHDGARHSVGASIGLVSITHEASGVASLLSMADTACYAAKEDGRNRVHVYDDNLKQMQSRQAEMQLTPRIFSALENNQFALHRQVIIPLSNGSAPHYEILIRMIGENNSIISPADFLGAAERFGVTPQIDRWVIERVFRHFAHHPELIEQMGGCSINLSGLTLSIPRFELFIEGLLKTYAVPAHKICFEITETSAVTNLHRTLEFMHAIRKLGCSFALDDFGRGVSSYYYLKNLPVDYLKIDGAFVRSMQHDTVDYAMVKSINDVGHAMGKKTIAEYVENGHIEHQLRALGVDFAQGYHLGRPELFIPHDT